MNRGSVSVEYHVEVLVPVILMSRYVTSEHGDQCPVLSFDQSIGLRMVGGRVDFFDSQPIHESLEDGCLELRSLVRL